jgi:hypothetical protein
MKLFLWITGAPVGVRIGYLWDTEEDVISGNTVENVSTCLGIPGR